MSSSNKNQQIAIHHHSGPLLIIAGPGSGKTYTLVERIINLVIVHAAAPDQLLVVTFTEKAAQELKTRLSNRVIELGIDFNINEMYLGTFHSICLRILEEYREYTRLKRSFVLMDQFDQQYFIYQKLREFNNIEGIEYIQGEQKLPAWIKSENLIGWLNKVSEEVLDVEELCRSSDVAINALGNSYKVYQTLLAKNNALDFSCIQLETYYLLRENPHLLKKLQEKLEYLMVDEYQDTNTIQEKLLYLLMGEKQNLCVVGDDDQALYRFRGASVRNILEFPQKFPLGRCQQVKLSINYRSHPEIVRFYDTYMQEKPWLRKGINYRYSKNIVARDGIFPNGPTVVSAITPEGDDWHDDVYQLLIHLRDNGKLKDWNQVAFLFRSVKNDKVKLLAKFLEDKGIPVYSPRANLFFEREEIRLMLGVLHLVFPMVLPDRKKRIQEGKTLPIWTYYEQQCLSPLISELSKIEHLDLVSWCKKKAHEHIKLTKSADNSFLGIFYEILQFPLFSKYLDQKNGNARAQRNLAQFSRMLGKFEYLHHISVLNPKYIERNLRDLFDNFLRFLHDGGIDEYEDMSEYAPSGCISFLTIHQSKGLEFPIVFVGSLEATPRKQYTDLDEIIETQYMGKKPFEPLDDTKYFDFWRLYYTAFSRSQNLLILTGQGKSGHGRTPSRHFVDCTASLTYWREAKFQLAALDIESVKDVNIKNEYAFTSHITLFETCAEQYRLFKELEFQPVKASPMLFGTLIHETLEDIHKIALRDEGFKITKDNVKIWLMDNYQNLANRERMYLGESTLGAALNHVMRYVERKNDDWSDIKETEVDISLVKSHYILTGSVDLIKGADGTVELVDFKSERKPDMERDKERIQHHKRQLEIYAHLVEERYGYQVSKMHLYFTGETNGLPNISFNKTSGTIDKTVAEFDRIVGRIESKDFSLKSRPDKTCVDCSARAYCDRKNWNFCG
ncbi:ATP-dependent helicase [Pantoea endophytica]|uniref:DNA 3'-5' helicase n=1 Tax=Pantoea endophytica TaxID=92488 RepID=A0ABX4SKU0_9GAMM|nr:UvrD-helicase domain-containing protein [Pantoea endophytica]PLR19534.1 ATP-dependent helicase [Pantoea endophytica]